MKHSLFVLSTLSNVLLLGAGGAHWLGWLTLPNHVQFEPRSVIVEPGAQPAPSPALLTRPPSSGIRTTFAWTVIESQDYREYIRNLRRVGCPEETIADIIVADVRKLFAHDRAKLQGSTIVGGALSTQLSALDRRENEVLEALLGQNWRFSLPETVADVDHRFPGQSTETVRQILELERAFNDQTEAVAAQSIGSLTKEDRDTLRRLRQEKEQGIAALLGPQGYEDYRIKSSSSVQALSQSPWFSFKDEEEFRAIAKAQIQWDQSMEDAEGSAEQQNQQKVAEKAYLEAVQKVTGPERFAEFERARDYRYQQIASLAMRYGLPDGTASQVFAIRQSLDNQLNQSTRTAAISVDPAVLREQSQEQIRGLLGQAAFASYCQNVPE